MTITFTLDLEDHHPQPNPAPRYPEITHKILDFLTERKVKGTFFVLGELAERHPELIRTIHQQGHEIGFHTYAHVPLNRENPERFLEQTRRSKAFLEDLIWRGSNRLSSAYFFADAVHAVGLADSGGIGISLYVERAAASPSTVWVSWSAAASIPLEGFAGGTSGSDRTDWPDIYALSGRSVYALLAGFPFG